MFYNTVSLYGQVTEKPVIHKIPGESDGDGHFSVKILRRPYINNDGVFSGKLHFSSPVVFVRGKTLMRKAAKIRKGDMVSIRGMLLSCDIKKRAECDCGNVKAVPGTLTYVNALNIRRCEKGVDQIRGSELLKENAIESNTVILFGSLRRAPEIYEPEHGKIKRALYQISVYRTARKIGDFIANNKPEDYIWVKNFGSQAAGVEKYAKGDRVFIEGSIDTRAITQTTQCDKCGNEYEWDESVTEVIPYLTEHFRK